MGTTHSTNKYGLKLGSFNLLIIYIIMEFVNECVTLIMLQKSEESTYDVLFDET